MIVKKPCEPVVCKLHTTEEQEMVRRALRWSAIAMAGLALAGAATAADEIKKRPAAPSGFYARFLMPQMASRLSGEIASAADFVNPRADQWTRDPGTVARVEENAIKSSGR